MSNRIFYKNYIGYAAIFLALMLIFSYIETIIPFDFGYLGVKLGLCNIVTIICFKKTTLKMTLILNILRLIIIGILFGNLIRFILSVSGFIISFVVMCICNYIFKFSIITTSIFGGAFHNFGQILALIIINKNIDLIKILPIYIIIGIFTGFIIGIISSIIYKKIEYIDIHSI